jgi:hypothetical protein
MAEQKKSKVLSCDFQREWTGQYGTAYSFLVKFENGDSGQVNFKKKDDTYFQVGKLVDYTIEQTTRPDGVTKDWKIGKVKTDNPYNKGGYKPRGAKSYKAEAVMVAGTNAANVIGMRDDLTEKEYPLYFKAFLKVMYAEIDNLFKE